ncbi:MULTISPECIES: SsgA family sporulation/cell division regulator [Streptomyces]|uniref:SsgA family sporulation/cell division regulator n=1 Tax=Streptomyces TaxID=1883 RepID=UPI00073AE376|nr:MULTISPECIES: SsgA family sporulation/cell division regulator [Streptomyces]ALV34249.1 SsgD protein [Streptomyces sp. CdTB01]MCL6667772.1 SsgA family sporulation/cell division regulator [Streptomyces panaciradicis]
MPITLEQPTGAHLLTPDGDELAVPVTLRYTCADALAVHFVFPAWISLDDEEVTWTFARVLLHEGLGAPAGVGSVRIRPCGPARTYVEFRTPAGIAVVRFDTSALRRFLLRSYEIAAPGGEAVGPALDRGLASMLGGV